MADILEDSLSESETTIVYKGNEDELLNSQETGKHKIMSEYFVLKCNLILDKELCVHSGKAPKVTSDSNEEFDDLGNSPSISIGMAIWKFLKKYFYSSNFLGVNEKIEDQQNTGIIKEKVKSNLVEVPSAINEPSTSKSVLPKDEIDDLLPRPFNATVNMDANGKYNVFREALNRERSAKRKVRSYEKKLQSPLANLTIWEQRDFERAKSVLSDPKLIDFISTFKDKPVGASVSNKIDEVVSSLMNCNVYDKAIGNEAFNKRKRSEDEEALNEAKKIRPPRAEDDKLRIFVINMKAKDMKITSDLWIETEGDILETLCNFYDSAEDTPELEFQGAGWDRSGHKVVACADKLTVSWLMGTINSLPKTDTLDRKAIYYNELNQYDIPRGWIWIPPPIKPDEMVLKLIGKQNKWLNTDGWKITKKAVNDENRMDKRRGSKYYLAMNREAIPALKEREFIIQYSLAKAVIYLFGNNGNESE